LTHVTARVGIRALQQNASAVVSRAAGGEIVEITDRGRPVAQLVPITQGRLAALAAAGLARPARRKVSDLGPALPREPGTPSLGELLAEARAGER
jgi:prevent-host-death family protein